MRPLSVLMSEAALEQGGIEVGDEIRLRIGTAPLRVQVAGAFDHFPTWEPGLDPSLVVVDRRTLLSGCFPARRRGTALAVDDELWTAAPLSEFANLMSAAEIPLDGADVITLTSARADLEADPLIVAAWNGVFIGALAAVGIAAAFGLVVLIAVTAQSRRVEFAVCQSVGMSTRQILGLIAIEQLVVISIGLTAGLIVGTQSGAILLDFFALTPDGRDVGATAAVRGRLAGRGGDFSACWRACSRSTWRRSSGSCAASNCTARCVWRHRPQTAMRPA